MKTSNNYKFSIKKEIKIKKISSSNDVFLINQKKSTNTGVAKFLNKFN